MSEFSPSWWARTVGHATNWRIRCDSASVTIWIGEESLTGGVESLRARTLVRRLVWGSMAFAGSDPPIVLDGIGRARLVRLDRELGKIVAEADRLEGLRMAFLQDGEVVRAWWDGVLRDEVGRRGRWIPVEMVNNWIAARPQLAGDPFRSVDREVGLAEFRAAQPQELRDAIEAWRTVDLAAWTAQRNRRFLAAERREQREFFATVEKSPLTDEQIEAVVTVDNRVRVIAAAGSGKTSTMVARAGYALKKGIVPADEILLLAFNTKAAEELRGRIAKRLGNRAAGITASMFHAFGQSVIGEAVGRKPRVMRQLAHDDGVGRVHELAVRLRATDPKFAAAWWLFKLVYGRPLPDLDEEPPPEGWDRTGSRAGFRTLGGEVVKSQEERMIANWLFFNGVRYEYERDYPVDTADHQHGQCRPDFYYPGIDAWHEHREIGPDGRPPAYFKGYGERMRWSREVHARYGTTLLETTSASVRDGSAFAYLTEQLTSRGIELDPNPTGRSRESHPSATATSNACCARS